ncbi:Uncharacterised protein [BD1-7 clade bacterium]|uniref:YecA family protein n=1 Tax=BD1-7 clade bacterium TaxID=2029982 RepID=A0A5S9QCB3_9GAMM|nr:Uncharacterised protein [BD1-7 clade bacterium]
MSGKKVRPLVFDEVCDLFIALGANNSPSEMHGLLGGQLAAGKRMEMDEWLAEAREFIDTEASFTKEQREQLQYVYMSTLIALADDELGFYPLLPDDEADFDARLRCLAFWCQGFLAGFALVEKKIKDLPEVVNDALNDLAAISQLQTEDDENSDDNAEDDYMQIVEYVRLAAMNIFVEYAVDAIDAEDDAVQGKDYLDAQSLFKSRQLH